MGEKALNIGGMIVTGAVAVAILTNKNFVGVIRAFGTAFTGAVRAATGK